MMYVGIKNLPMIGLRTDIVAVSDRYTQVQDRRARHVRCGSKADIGAPASNVRFVPKADILRCGKERRYSMTSSASNCIDVGTSRPRVFAVLRLMTSSNFVGAWIGRSAGFSPLRMRSMYSGTWRNCST